MFVIDTELNGNRIEVFELTVGTFLIAFNNQIVKRGLSPIEVMQWMGNAMANVRTKSDGKEVIVYIRAGKFIDAIKLHRQYTGWGLKESKDACERAREKLKVNPEWTAELKEW